MQSADIIIIGAGAAGLMAAASAGGRGRSVLLLEKNRKLGVKILISGGTRCNITHNCDARGIINAFGRQGRFLHSALAALSPLDVVAIVNGQGVATKIESNGKIFPASDRAIDVRDAIVDFATSAGAQILNEQPVEKISRDESGFMIETANDRFTAPRLIIASGGRSYPGCGTTGDGYTWAEQFGHSIVRTVPALTPITCNESWANKLRGITIEDTEIAVWNRHDQHSGQQDQSGDARQSNPNEIQSGKVARKRAKQKPLDLNRGSFLFTHFGFSGPAVLNVSRAITRRDSPAGLTVALDFLPGIEKEVLFVQIRKQCSANGRQTIANQIGSLLPARLAAELVNRAAIDARTKNAELSNEKMRMLVEQIKCSRLPVSGTLGFNKAEVTAGGVALGEVDSSTMSSKLCDGLFFAGEILDLDGLIGGFNFQSAFSTGWLAGRACQ